MLLLNLLIDVVLLCLRSLLFGLGWLLFGWLPFMALAHCRITFVGLRFFWGCFVVLGFVGGYFIRCGYF